jgi:serine/threonine-protein kinase RsbW
VTGHEALLTAPPGDLGVVHGLLASVWSDAPSVGARDRMSFETALLELAGNVLAHADGGTGLTCTVKIEVGPDILVALLEDDGRPGRVDLADRVMPDALAESGRGIPLIHALVDDLDYERDRGVNRWRIARRLVGAGRS